ncbi:hypothetical protein HanIR_Chr10g0464051 [Helianthus annuus]|nr:hypothetical protein HanIR_Chr10g0464051 [Helianthus annuus]
MVPWPELYSCYKRGCLVYLKGITWQTTTLPLCHNSTTTTTPTPTTIIHHPSLECVVVSGSKIDCKSSCQSKAMFG